MSRALSQRVPLLIRSQRTLQRGCCVGRRRLCRRRACRRRNELCLCFFEHLSLFRIKFAFFGSSHVILCSLEFGCVDQHQRDVNGCVGILQCFRRQTSDNSNSL